MADEPALKFARERVAAKAHTLSYAANVQIGNLDDDPNLQALATYAREVSDAAIEARDCLCELGAAPEDVERIEALILPPAERDPLEVIASVIGTHVVPGCPWGDVLPALTAAGYEIVKKEPRP